MPRKKPVSSLTKPAKRAALRQRIKGAYPSRPQTLSWLCFAALLSACGQQADNPDLALPPSAITGTEITRIRHIHVADGVCAPILRRNLQGHGFDMRGNSPVHAILTLSLRQRRPLRESLPVIESLGEQAKYEATLTGAGGARLLTLYGEEGALSFDELCDDIGDEIADRLAEFLPRK